MRNLYYRRELQNNQFNHEDQRKKTNIYGIGLKNHDFVDIFGVARKQRASDLNVNCLRPPLTTRHIRCVLLINNHYKLNLHVLSWLLIYL